MLLYPFNSVSGTENVLPCFSWRPLTGRWHFYFHVLHKREFLQNLGIETHIVQSNWEERKQWGNQFIHFTLYLLRLKVCWLQHGRTRSGSEMVNHIEPKMLSHLGRQTSDALNLTRWNSKVFHLMLVFSKEQQKKRRRFLFWLGFHTCGLNIYSIRWIVVLSTGSWLFVIKIDKSPILVNKNLFLVIV